MTPALEDALIKAQRAILDPEATREDMRAAKEEVDAFDDRDASHAVAMMLGERVAAEGGYGLGAEEDIDEDGDFSDIPESVLARFMKMKRR